MSSENVIEETANYRLTIDYDQFFTEKPWGDTYAPVLRIDLSRYGGYRGHAVHVDEGGRPHDDDDAIENAVSHWQTSPADADWERYFLRYLKAYYGVTQVTWFSSDDYWYVSYDSATWREYAGITDDQLPMSENFLADWEAWANGEVYTFSIEKKVRVCQNRRVYNPDDGMRTETADYESWEYVDGSGGFYGYDYAKSEALERFNAIKGDDE